MPGVQNLVHCFMQQMQSMKQSIDAIAGNHCNPMAVSQPAQFQHQSPGARKLLTRVSSALQLTDGDPLAEEHELPSTSSSSSAAPVPQPPAKLSAVAAASLIAECIGSRTEAKKDEPTPVDDKPKTAPKSKAKAKAKAKTNAAKAKGNARQFGCTKCRGKVGCTGSCISGNTRPWSKQEAEDYKKKQRKA